MMRIKTSNQVRIIAGSLRGRKITFPDSLGLRPTPDRVRETLFNWLNPMIRGSTCLDLFAGSGALSFEAISRGAKKVVALEKAVYVSSSIQEQILKFNIANLEVKNIDSQIYLADIHFRGGDELNFDVVFVDPPYGSQLLFPSFSLLSSGTWVKKGTLIYAGTDDAIKPEDLPEGWKIIRHQKAGVVYFYLIEVIEVSA